MTTPQQQPPAPAAPQQQPPAAAGQGEETRVHTIAELASRQERTESKLDQILARLPGAGPAPAPAAPAPQQQQAAADPGTVAEQMRQAVRDVAAEQRNAQTQQQPAAPPAETRPREVALKGKARLQKAFFGALDGQR